MFPYVRLKILRHKNQTSTGVTSDVFETLEQLLGLEKFSCPSEQFQFTSGTATQDVCWSGHAARRSGSIRSIQCQQQ